MAKRKYYVGSVGPLLYDDESPIGDQDGDFAGEDRVALRTDGSVRASGTDDHEDSLVKKSTNDALQNEVDNLATTVDDLDTYAKDHGGEHLPAGTDPLPTKVVTVVTAVDFTTDTVTTENITVIDN